MVLAIWVLMELMKTQFNFLLTPATHYMPLLMSLIHCRSFVRDAFTINLCSKQITLCHLSFYETFPLQYSWRIVVC